MNNIISFNEWREKRERELARQQINADDWLIAEGDLAVQYLAHETDNPRLVCLHVFCELAGLLGSNGHTNKELISLVRLAARKARLGKGEIGKNPGNESG